MDERYFDDAQLALLAEALREEDIDVLKEEEVGQILLHQLIEMQVERTPDAIAIVFEGEKRSYRELNNAANHLAYRLQNLGVGPDMLVGVSMERSVEMMVALIAVLKAGGAYVPLDPTYPSERLAYMLQDANVQVLLTQPHIKTRLPQTNAQVLYPEIDWAYKQANPPSNTQASHLAYMIYTSGSTGNPKGVMCSHRAVCNHLRWICDLMGLAAHDHILQKTPLSFDASVTECFASLVSGGRLVLALPEGHKDPAYLMQIIEREQISLIQFVPSLLRIWIEEAGLERCTSLHHILVGGEALTRDLQARCLVRCQPGVRLYNLYGPTEAATDASYWVCRSEELNQADVFIPIGHPIANTQMYVLNQHLQPVSIGGTGEIYIGGMGLARGYFQRPDLTAERFIADPFGVQPGERLYRTGDVARYRVDGAIEFLGRLDHQVKLRGFRIELGEIETLLAQHPQIQECVVTTQDEESGNTRLVAYLVLKQGQGLNIAEIRRFLQGKLPEYMVPMMFMSLDTFPLTANGKLDRRRLSMPDYIASLRASTEQSSPEGQPSPTRVAGQANTRASFIDSPYVEPQDEIEQTVASVWSALLEIDQVGMYDNFFELGGHSLLAIQAVARLRQHYPIEFTLRDFLSPEPTIANMSRAIEEMLATKLETLTDEQALQLLQTLKDA